MEEAPPEVYMPERALFRALEAWLPEFRLFVDADGKRPSADPEDEVKSESHPRVNSLSFYTRV